MNSAKADYLVVGGFAVGFHGTPRATGDLDIWIAARADNATRLVAALEAFGFAKGSIDPALFAQPQKTIRMGMPPLRIEILTGLTGVDFASCYTRRHTVEVDGVPVNFISLEDLKLNKKAAGRAKDLGDLEYLP